VGTSVVLLVLSHAQVYIDAEGRKLTGKAAFRKYSKEHRKSKPRGNRAKAKKRSGFRGKGRRKSGR
jgi:hypothetical protein